MSSFGKMGRFLRKIRFSFRLIKAFLQRHKKVLIASCLVSLCLFLLLPKIFHLLARKKALRIGLVGKFTINELPKKVQNLISDGLTEIDNQGQVKPKLAQSWETNHQGKEYLFRLKNNLFWHDGKPVLAEDIQYNFQDVTTQILDNQTIKFELLEPFSPFPAIVAQSIFKKGLVGTGEYQVKKITHNGQIVEKLTLANQQKKSQPLLIFRFYPTEKTALTAFKLGEIDQLDDIAKLQELDSWLNIQTEAKVKTDRYVAVFFNTQKPKLEEKSTRQALAYAIDKHWQPRALGPFNPQSWAYNAQVKKYAYNPAKAKELLTKTNEDEALVIEKIELATVPSLLTVAEEIKKNWEAIGVATRIKVIASLDQDYEAILISQQSPSDPDQYVFWHSTQTLSANISHYKSPKLDKLLEDGRKTFDQEKRKTIYFDFQKFLVEDTPAVFLYHPTLYTLTRI